MSYPQALVLMLFALLWRPFDAFAQNSPSRSIGFADEVHLAGYAGGIALEWATYDEASVDYYAIQRLRNGIEETVATLQPRKLQDSVIRYRYIEQNDYVPGLAFQLRVVFSDGEYAASEWLDAEKVHGTRTRILSALDQESIARLRLSMESERDQRVVVRVKTLAGEMVDTYYRELKGGLNDVDIDYSGWPSGYYTVELDDQENRREWLIHVDANVPVVTTRQIPRG